MHYFYTVLLLFDLLLHTAINVMFLLKSLFNSKIKIIILNHAFYSFETFFSFEYEKNWSDFLLSIQENFKERF